LIENKDFDRVRHALERIDLVKDDVVKVAILAFNPSQVYELLKGKVDIPDFNKVDPTLKMIRTRHRCLLQGEPEDVTIAMENFARTTIPTDPELLTKVVVLAGSGSLFERNKDKLVYPILYEYMAKYQPEGIMKVFPPKFRTES
jgi:hypothetical protein